MVGVAMADDESFTVASWAAAANALVAKAVVAARALPASHSLGTSDGPKGYRRSSTMLSDLCAELRTRISDRPCRELGALERCHDALLCSLDNDFRRLEGRASPPPSPENVTSVATPTASRQLIRRPQLSFKDPVDNDACSIWVPKIKIKPNAIAPLKLIEKFDETGLSLGYEHPYHPELAAYCPPDKFLCSTIATPTKSKDVTSLIYIDSEHQLNELVEHLSTVEEIAFDLEHHSYRTFQGITCLMQITTDQGGDFIIDTLALREYMHILNKVFTDPKILKVAHGADSDVIWLQRDFGVYIVGLFDTHVAAIELNYPSRTWQTLLMKYCKEPINKQFQLADWRMRPLTDGMIDYARSDTHNLLYVARCMRNELLCRSDALLSVFEKSKTICLKTYVKPSFDDYLHLELSKKSKKTFNSRQMAALKSLYRWRDGIAREEDESTAYVLPNHMLLEIATALPKETSGILACCVPTPPLLLQYLHEVLKLIVDARYEIITDVVSNKIPVNIENKLPSLMIYDRQTYPTTNEPNKLLQTLDRLQNTEIIADTEKYIVKKIESLEITKSFVSPFERYNLIKKYNDALASEKAAQAKELAANTPARTNNNENNSIEIIECTEPNRNKIKLIRENSDEENDTDKAKQIESPLKKKKKDDFEPEFQHKFKKPKNKSTPDDPNFKPFDYKSFNFKVYDKGAPPNKRKRK